VVGPRPSGNWLRAAGIQTVKIGMDAGEPSLIANRQYRGSRLGQAFPRFALRTYRNRLPRVSYPGRSAWLSFQFSDVAPIGVQSKARWTLCCYSTLGDRRFGLLRFPAGEDRS